MISTILFDMNDLLYSYDRSVRVAHIARICGEPAEAIWASGFEDSGDNGVMDADAYLSGFGERLGRRLTQDEWTEALRASVTPIAETLTLAASVRRQVRVAVLTNNNLLVKRTVDTVFSELRPIFGRTFLFQLNFTDESPNRRPIFVAWRASALRRTRRCSSTTAPRMWPARSALGCAHIYIAAPTAWRGR